MAAYVAKYHITFQYWSTHLFVKEQKIAVCGLCVQLHSYLLETGLLTSRKWSTEMSEQALQVFGHKWMSGTVSYRRMWWGPDFKWWEFQSEVVGMALTVGAAVVAVMLEVVGTVPHTAAAALGFGCVAVTLLALASGRQDRCKAQCSCLSPSNKPHLRGTWVSTCSKGNNHYNWPGSIRVKVEMKKKTKKCKWRWQGTQSKMKKKKWTEWMNEQRCDGGHTG